MIQKKNIDTIAQHILNYIHEHGCVFDQVNVNKKAVRMINILHTKAWAKYGDLKSVVVSYRGGRQGCKLGGVIFGAVYAVAIREVRLRMNAKGITVNLNFEGIRYYGVPER